MLGLRVDAGVFLTRVAYHPGGRDRAGHRANGADILKWMETMTHRKNGPPVSESSIAGEMNFEFSFAFQPIVDARAHDIISFEALVRGPAGEPSDDVFAQVAPHDLHRFDYLCRDKAIRLANSLKLDKRLNLNLFPSAVYQAGMNIRATLQASVACGFPAEKIIFEVTESEKFIDYHQLVANIRLYKDFGFQTAIDDFGSGFSGLNMLVEYQPRYIKLDRNLIADIHENEVRQTIFEGISLICKRLGIEIMAEGVETAEEYEWLVTRGINFFQGFYFAKPAFEDLPGVDTVLFRV